jgi:hypothetical protein
MHSPQRPDKSGTEGAVKVVRRMGMAMSIIGSIIMALGLVLNFYDVREDLNTRSALTLILGAALFISGLYIWRSSQKAG